MNSKGTWVKEAEINLDEDRYLFFFNDILFYPVISKVTERTGLLEEVLSFLDRKNKIISIFSSQDSKRGDWGYEFFLNEKKYKRYLDEVQQVFRRAEKFRKKMDSLDLEKTSLKKKIEIFTKDIDNLIEAKVLVYFTIDPYYWKVEESLKNKLLEIVPQDKLSEVLGILVLQNDRDALESERYDWLRNVVFPIMKKGLEFEEVKRDKDILSKINLHLSKYKTYPSGFDTDLWNLEDYLELLKEDLTQDKAVAKSEFEQLRDKEFVNKKKREDLIRKYKISEDVVKKAQIIGKLANIRLNLRVMAWSFYLYVFRKLLDECSKISGLAKKEIGLLTYEEFIGLLKSNFKINSQLKQKIEERKNGDILAISDLDGKFKLLCGELATKRFYEDIEPIKEIKEINEFKGEVACRKGVVRGKVFIFRYGSPDFVSRISQFPKGDVLVANMTLPVLMPAIRRASAVVTDGGGITCHAAIVSRELGIPCVIGTGIATKILKDGDEIEVDTNTGIIKLIKRAN